MTVLNVLFIIVNFALAAYAGRRPASIWAAADRRKAFWVVMLLICGAFQKAPTSPVEKR